MARTSDLDRVAMVVLRYMRRPVFVLVFVYAVGIFGMAAIPGVPQGDEPRYMSLFHAFYFFTYTATTTGFGEIPGDFSDEQRLWAIVCLYFGVIAWLYAIGVTVIDPFDVLARLVTMAITKPRLQNLNRWLVRARGIELGRPLILPKGRWLLCGFGRMGKSLHEHFVSDGIETCVLDAKADRKGTDGEVMTNDADFLNT